MSEMRIKVGDDRPWYSVLRSAVDSDLTDIATVKLYMRLQGGSANKINNATVVIESKTTTTANVRYDPVAADVDTKGTYDMYWKATFTTGGKDARFPSEGYDKVIIAASLE